MEQAVRVLKERKIRVTPQRVEVLRVLRCKNCHLTAEEVYEKLKPKLPAISLATIYTVLELFKGKGIVNEMHIRPDKACFDMRVDRHHHFLCTCCGIIFDVDIQPCSTLKKGEVQGHKIEDLQGYFYGICKNCRKK